MSEKLDLTVIINVLNGASTIGRAIDSVLSQSVKPRRLIVWDNRSTDHTSSVATSYSDVDYYLSEERTSLGAARELARQHVDTPWIAYLDADDYWYQDKLLQQSSFIAFDIGVVYSAVEERTESGRLLRVNRPTYPNGWQVNNHLRRFDISLVTALLNNTLLNKYDISFDPAMRASEEQDLLLRLACVAPFVSLSFVHGCITVSEASLTNQSIHLWATERRRTLSKLQSSYSGTFLQSALNESYNQATYYEIVYLMRSKHYHIARRRMWQLCRPFQLKYFLLYCLTLAPCAWEIFHTRQVKSALTRLLRHVLPL
jgi:glycosyltransferase involved in cell wall biosynthesis